MSLFGSFGNQFLNQIATNDSVKDYQHAARTFVDSVYRLGPKSTALFHVYIDLNPVVTYDQPTEIGLMAKTAALPKFNIQNKVLNAYNRKNIVQERVTYDPLTITFHDDSADVVRKFWQNYYEYYYRDSDHAEALYNIPHKYDLRSAQNWGYSPRGTAGYTEAAAPNFPNFINSIRIYSLHQKQYSGYVLVRPTITSFQHGQHQQGEYNTLEHSMTVAFEAVKYEIGSVSAGGARGFGQLHYDRVPSPLASAGGTQSILGPGGLVQSGSDIFTNLASGNILGAALGTARTYKTFKNADLKSIASSELKQTAKNILLGQNTQSTVFVPTQKAIQDGLSKAVQSIPGIKRSVSTLDNMNNQSSQVPSTNQGIIGGA